mmetsp:Transcript_2537/g.6350  ORF Transcript_2537/g.6350 Transcript_2537/m.6350 type:complete len:213 (+) Transcript_2537:1597-2235(+)
MLAAEGRRALLHAAPQGVQTWQVEAAEGEAPKPLQQDTRAEVVPDGIPRDRLETKGQMHVEQDLFDEPRHTRGVEARNLAELPVCEVVDQRLAERLAVVGALWQWAPPQARPRALRRRPRAGRGLLVRRSWYRPHGYRRRQQGVLVHLFGRAFRHQLGVICVHRIVGAAAQGIEALRHECHEVRDRDGAIFSTEVVQEARDLRVAQHLRWNA